MTRHPLLALTATFTLVLGACGDAETSPTSSTAQVRVAAAFYPIDTLVRSVGGDRVDVVPLVPPGEEAHDYEPTAKQVEALSSSDVVFFLGNGFQPNVERLIEQLPDSVTVVDLLDSVELLALEEDGGDHEGDKAEEDGEDHDHGDFDPHVWLDPMNMAAMAATVESTLAAADADGAASYAANGAALASDLGDLDAAMATGLQSCATTILVTGHEAFGYLADAYALTQVAISGISPAEEPSAETMSEIAEYAFDNDVTTIFFEENLPPDLSETIADEIGAATAVLDPLESPSSEQLDDGETYFSMMEENLATLRAGLRCP